MILKIDNWKVEMLLRIVRNAKDRCAGEYKCEMCHMSESCNYLILEKELMKYEKKFDL